MVPVNSLRDLSAIITFALEINEPFLLCGPTGCAKTELVRAIGANMKMKVVVLNLSVMVATDFIGLPLTRNDKTTYAKPFWWPDPSQEGLFVIYLDEINRAPLEMLNPCLQLITLREINGHVLHPDCRIVAAMNPNAEGYQVNELDPALLARFLQVEFVPDPAGWVDWAERQGQLDPAKKYHSTVLNYVASTPNIFDGVSSNPRAWTAVNKIVKGVEAAGLDSKFMRKLVEAKVGAELARSFMKIYSAGPRTVMPKAEQILKGTARMRELVRAITQSGDTAAAEGMLLQVLSYLQDPDRCADVRGSPKALAALRKFQGDLPADLGERLAKRLPWLKEKGAKK